MWALPQIFFLKFSRGSDRKNQTGQAINEWEAYQWSGKCGNSLVCESSSSLFRLFSGYHARNLAIILSHLNVIFFHIYSKMSAVFLTMALLFRCLLAYRLKKRRMSACSSCFFLLSPTFISFKHQWQSESDWAVFSNDCREPAFTDSTKCTIEGGGHSFVSLVFPKLKVNRK